MPDTPDSYLPHLKPLLPELHATLHLIAKPTTVGILALVRLTFSMGAQTKNCLVTTG